MQGLMNRQHFTNWAISPATFPQILSLIIETQSYPLQRCIWVTCDFYLRTWTWPLYTNKTEAHSLSALSRVIWQQDSNQSICVICHSDSLPDPKLGLPHFVLLLICVPGRGHWTPGSHRHRCWELNLSPLWEERALTTAEPPLQSCPATSDSSGDMALLVWFFQNGGWKPLYQKEVGWLFRKK